MANNFNVPRCKALWEFEDGALGVDSREVNTLTLYGSGTAPTADADCREGSASALFVRANSQHFFISNSKLADGFPFKSNDPAKLATICFWVKFATLPASGQYHNLLTKSLSGYDACFEAQLCYNSGVKFRLVWGYSATQQNTWDVFAPSANRWYHVSIRIDGVNKTWRCRVYDATAGTTNNYTGPAPADVLHLSSRRWYIGAYDMGQNCLDGRMDEILFFNALLQDEELSSVQAGTFDFGDPRLQARYRFESDALTADSKGTNTLTASGGMPTADTVDFKTGAASLYLAGSGQHLRIADASQGPLFPFKNGDTWLSGAFTSWWKFYSVSQGTLFGKFLPSNYGWRVCLSTNNHLFITLANSASGKTEIDTGITVIPGRWYFIGFTMDQRNATNSYYWVRMYVYDPTDDQVYTYQSQQVLYGGYYGTTNPFAIGANSDGSSPVIARVDQFAVFDEWLFDAEFEALSKDRCNGRNDILSDVGLKALWDFEDSPGAWVDSVKGLALKTVGSPSASASSGFNRKSWEKGALFDKGGAALKYFSITDANLAAGFPLKSGDATKKISVTMWVKPYSTAPTYFRYLFAKHQSSVSYRSFAIYLLGTRLKVTWVKSTDQYTVYEIDTGIDLAVGEWFHVGVAVDGVNRSLYVRVYRVSTGAVSTFSNTPAAALAVNTCTLAIGQRGDAGTYCGFHGVIDEVAVFAGVLSAGDIDSIRAHTYNFAGDANCKALWLFEPGALTADSKGTNTLTNNNSVGSAPECREGSGAALFDGDSHQYATIADAALPSGFPLKNGDTAKQISICFWVRPWTIDYTYEHMVLCKGEYGKFSLGCVFRGGTPSNWFKVYWGYNGGASAEQCISTQVFVPNRWFHVGIVADGIAKTCYVRVYDYSAKTIQVDQTWNMTNEMWVGDPALTLGTQLGNDNALDGTLDEVMFFNRLLSSDEIDLIRARSFVPTDQQKVVHVSAYFEYGPNDLPPRRVFPMPPPRLRQQSQMSRRVFPVIP